MTRTFVDRGGTFTDVVVVEDDGRVRIRKIRSDEAVVGALAEGDLTFGTTVATNALLERKGVRTLVVVNEGMGDLLRIGDTARPDLFNPDSEYPPPLSAHVLEVQGRMDSAGREVEALQLPEWPEGDWEAVAIALLHSPRNPDHELRLAQAIEEHFRRLGRPAPFLSLGHLVSPEVGYLPRLDTSLVDAAITPILQAAMDRDQIPAEAKAMRSDGSLCPAPELAAPHAVLSGPAGGVLAVAAVARQAGFQKAVGLDMGGTSTDICRVEGANLPRREEHLLIAGVRLGGRMLEVETIAAGGGSILSNDGLRLQVGPESAGADPGPQCYGRGGPPTLTDAALAAGLIDPAGFNPPLDQDRISLPAPAEDFLDLARERMAQAVRRIATARGVDLRDHALVAYGGAAGQHAADVAGRLGISTVLVHPCASVLSAYGQSLAREEESLAHPMWRPLPDAWGDCLAVFRDLRLRLPDMGEEIYAAELRYAGTDHGFVLEIEPTPKALADLLEAFRCEHKKRFGFDRPSLGVEVVNLSVCVRAPAPSPPEVQSKIWDLPGDDDPEALIKGPRLITSPTTSVWVPQGWTAKQQVGLLVLTPEAQPEQPQPRVRTPYAVELWGNRFMAVAEQSGAMLRRLARSVNIRERLDFSCALFDAAGRLVANAPHIPVHLGAMGETVRDLLKGARPPEPGQAYLSNDPVCGGSHLPDLTVVTPVQLGDAMVFVANRAHHVDVGGLTPGSMPPRSTTLSDEGFVVRQVPLLDGDRLAEDLDFLEESREPEIVRADLEAQIAANQHAASALQALADPEMIFTWMDHLHDVAQESVARVIERLPLGLATDTIGGVKMALRLERKAGRLLVDFSGTGGPHGGNFNAPRAVVRAAVLYALRVLVDRPIPLNEGALADIDIHLPEISILSPPPGSAVVGGNVETSQRLVDLFFRAVGARAASQGTMNNLTLGGDGWSYYETLGGGYGASQHSDGRSGAQVHMTNTKVTDVEVLETRFPLRIRRMAYRSGSGGEGARRGGDGLIREIEALDLVQAALLATRRGSGAPGLAGGAEGAPGKDTVFQGGRWVPWSGDPIELAPGDRVRVETPGGAGHGAC